MTAHPPPGPLARLLWLIVDTFRSPVVFEGTAKLCDGSHEVVYVYNFNRPPRDDPRGPLHVDLEGKLHNRGAQTTTVIGIRGTVAGQKLAPENFDEVTLEPGGPRADVSTELYLAAGDEFEFSAVGGEKVTLELRLTRGGLSAPRVKVKLAPNSR